MGLSIAEKRERALKKQKEAQQRARDKQIAKMNDPEWRNAQRAKQQASQEKQQAKQLAKLRDPEYIAKQRAKRQEQAIKAAAKPKKPVKKIASKGLKGRSATSAERGYMDKIGTLGCIACAKHGRDNPVVSLHHVYGRTIPDAHKFVLPLCAYHHDTLLPKEQREQYPDMLPVHAKGKYGGKHQFSQHNGTESDLLVSVYEKLGLPLSDLPNYLIAS